MSSEPIRRERAAWRAASPVLSTLKPGDLVRIVEGKYPAGFPIWRVAKIPPRAVQSDVATLDALSPRAPMQRTRRLVASLTLETAS